MAELFEENLKRDIELEFNHEAQLEADFEIYKIGNSNQLGTFSDISLTLGTRWGNHESIHFSSLVEMRKFILELSKFMNEAMKIEEKYISTAQALGVDPE